MKNIKEVVSGNDSVSLEFSSKRNKGSLTFSEGNFKLGDLKNGNYTSFNTYGEPRLHGEATQWEDLRFPATRLRQGALQKPDFDYTNLGLLFPQNDASERIYIIAQLPHAWKPGTTLRPHIHYVQDEATEPVFKMDYRIYNNGEDPTGAFTTLTASTFTFPYSSGSICQIVSFPEIDTTGINISSIMDIRLYRDDNIVTGDVLVKEFDIHYQIDSLGSNREYIKY